MKLFFIKEDSLYKIFKTLEKIPKQKKVMIEIESHNAFFEHERRGKQIKDLITTRNIDAVFICRTEKIKNYFHALWLQYDYQQTNQILKGINLITLFFFNAKKFHLTLYTKKNTIFYMIFAFEILVVLGVFYVLYRLILPSASINIKPAYSVEDIVYNFRYHTINDTNYTQDQAHLGIAYQTGLVPYKYTMAISTKNLKYFQNPSQGRVTLFNTLDREFNLVKGTKLITQDGIIFTTNFWVNIPAALSGGKPTETLVSVTAQDIDEQGKIIGSRGNIKKDTRLSIRNLKSSFFFNQIRAKSLENFKGGVTRSEGQVTADDINILSGKLLQYIYDNKKSIVRQYFKEPDAFLLNFNDLISTKVQQTVIKNKPGDRTSTLEGYIIVGLNYRYVRRSDFLETLMKYLDQRASNNTTLIDIEKNSLIMYDKTIDGNTYTIPTKINVIWWYNFDTDVNGIKEEIKSKIIGIKQQEAEQILKTYNEIGTYKLDITPPWYDEIPRLKSRILINVDRKVEFMNK